MVLVWDRQTQEPASCDHERGREPTRLSGLGLLSAHDGPGQPGVVGSLCPGDGPFASHRFSSWANASATATDMRIGHHSAMTGRAVSTNLSRASSWGGGSKAYTSFTSPRAGP